MANHIFQRLSRIAGSLDLLEHDLFQRRRRTDDVLDPLVAPKDRRTEQAGRAAGHRRRPDQQEELVEV
jgi:hypothetical protein